MVVVSESQVDAIDKEWLALIVEAHQLGLSIDVVQKFLNQDRD